MASYRLNPRLNERIRQRDELLAGPKTLSPDEMVRASYAAAARTRATIGATDSYGSGILTSSLGLLDEANIRRKRLLGA